MADTPIGVRLPDEVLARRMGFRFEGVLEAYVIAKECNHDSAWFRILDHEWPAAKTHLEGLLAAR